MTNETAHRQKEETTQAIPTLLRRLIHLSFALTVVSTMIGLLFSWGEETALVTALALMAGVLILVEALPRVMKLSIGPVKATLDKVGQRQDRQESDIEAIRVALRGILTKNEFGPLKALAGTGKVEIQKEPNLVKYLHRLDGLNFVQPNPESGLNLIEEIPNGKTFDLRNFFILPLKGEYI